MLLACPGYPPASLHLVCSLTLLLDIPILSYLNLDFLFTYKPHCSLVHLFSFSWNGTVHTGGGYEYPWHLTNS
jgi:hypothetical protein